MVLPGFAGGELWRWRGSNALNRAALMGLRRYSPAFSGHACPGCGPVDRCVPRICTRGISGEPDVVRGRRAAGVLRERQAPQRGELLERRQLDDPTSRVATLD